MQLFRYPSLVVENVVKLMDITAKYFISTLSRRMRNIVKRTSRKIAYNLHLLFDDNFLGQIFSCKDPEEFFGFEMSPILPAVDELDEKPTVNTDVIERKVKYLIEIFNSPVVSIFLTTGFPHRQFANCITHLNKMNIPLETVDYASLELDDDSLKFVLEQSRNAEEIKLPAVASPELVIGVDVIQSLKASRVGIPFSSWLTEDHLFNSLMNRSEVCVKFDFQPAVFNTFMKRWIEGSPITRFFCLLEYDYEFASCFGGIATNEVLGVTFDDRFYTLVRIIKQTEGQEAAVFKRFVEGGGYEFGLTTVYEVANAPNFEEDSDEEADPDEENAEGEVDDSEEDNYPDLEGEDEDDSDGSDDEEQVERWII